MKHLIFSLSILLTLSYYTQTSAEDIATVKKLNEDWIHSYPGKDTTTLSRIFADDLIMITPNGSRTSKST